MEGLETGIGAQQDSIIFQTAPENRPAAISSVGRGGRASLIICMTNGPSPVIPSYGSIPVKT
jgi:hypothetical protein